MNMFLGWSLIGVALIIMGGLLIKTNTRRPCRLAPLGAFLGRLLLAIPVAAAIAIGVAFFLTLAVLAFVMRDTPVWFLPLMAAFVLFAAAIRGRRPKPVQPAVPAPPPLRVLDLPLDDELSPTELRMMQPPGADWATAYNLAIWPRIRETGDN